MPPAVPFTGCPSPPSTVEARGGGGSPARRRKPDLCRRRPDPLRAPLLGGGGGAPDPRPRPPLSPDPPPPHAAVEACGGGDRIRGPHAASPPCGGGAPDPRPRPPLSHCRVKEREDTPGRRLGRRGELSGGRAGREEAGCELATERDGCAWAAVALEERRPAATERKCCAVRERASERESRWGERGGGEGREEARLGLLVLYWQQQRRGRVGRTGPRSVSWWAAPPLNRVMG